MRQRFFHASKVWAAPLLLALSCLSAFEGKVVFADDGPLNILLFTADDLHAESVGAFAGRPAGLTPNLDLFASTAMRFDRAHVNAAICAPCRAIIATGLYSHNSGAVGFVKARPGTPDFITVLQKAGYRAGILGKVPHSTPVPSMKWDYAFDQKQLGNGRNPDIYYARSKKFFEECKAAEKPFYFMVNSHDPHRPYCNPKKLTKGAAMPSKVFRADEVVVPGFLPDLPGVRAELAMYLNSTRRLDDTFGKVLQALDESGMTDRTLVAFLSDNGIAVPFAKCNSWFHSSRTPLLVRWPGVTAPGKVDAEHFVSTVDLAPTFLDAASVAAPTRQDGRTFVPLLRGERQDGRDHVFTQIDMKAGGDAVPMRAILTQRHAYIYNPFADGKHWYRNNNEGLSMRAMMEAAKTDPYVAARIKLFRYRTKEEFYDLTNDTDCLHNLIGDTSRQGVIDDLRSRLAEWMRATGDPLAETIHHQNDRAIIDAAITEAYKKHRGPNPQKPTKPGPKPRKKKRKTDAKP